MVDKDYNIDINSEDKFEINIEDTIYTLEINPTDTFEIQLNEQGPQGDRGPKGDIGDKGETGEQGPIGPQGPKGDKGDVGNTGPQGPKGDKGDAATITVGTTSTGLPGTQASVINSGTSSNAVLNFTIPQGIQGIQGVQGIQGIQGEQGIQGVQGEVGPQGVSVTGVSLIATAGLNKTYRMTFSNNTYFDYVVQDGASGATTWGGISGVLSNQTDLQNELTSLQSQIDAIVVSSDVFDIVATYTDLQNYDISTVPVNDIIKVLIDSTHSGSATYYRCIEINGSKSWSYIGSEGAYYTKAEADALLANKQNVINSNNKLSANYISGLSAVATSGSYNDLLNKPTIPTATSDLTNDSGFISGINSSDVTNALGYTPANDNAVVHNTGNETISGSKTFSNTIVADKGLTLDDSGTGLQLHYPLEFKINDGVLDFKIESSTTGGVTTNTFKAHTDISGLKSDIKFIDGQWVSKVEKIVDSVQNTNSTSVYLDSTGIQGAGQNYIPADYDGYNVEVMFLVRLGCNASKSGSVTATFGSDILDMVSNLSDNMMVCSKAVTRASVIPTLPIGTSRYFKYSLSGADSNTNFFTVYALGYRRIGTNS